nr:C69 family dipeptidase [uncultured Carboxylicivirga sp.]
MTKHLLPLAILFLSWISADACTNFLITKGASADHHNYIFYSNDGAYAPSFPVHPAGSYKNSDSIRIFSYPNQKEGYIPRAKHEYHTIGYHINEFNVSIGETTFGGRDELHNTNEFLEYWHLMELGLQRSKTAREMIDVIAELVQEYGYGSPGESFSIADPDEIWLMEMVGKGIDTKGAVWAAVRIPDGYISAHANHARIGEIEMDNPDNYKYSADVIDFAIEKGYYHPESGKAFSFCDTYDPVTPAKLRYTEMRVWDFFRRTAPSQNISTDYARGVEGAERMPLWIKPDEKLSFETIIALTHSHYDGTLWDMEKGLKAGPHGNPNRSRPLTFEVDGVEASWERPISTPLTAYAFIAELKTNKKKEANSVLWLGLDNTYTNIYMPFNACVSQIPQSYNNTKYDAFSWNSMWWVFNFVGNYVNLRYSDMIQDVKAKQASIQKDIIADFRDLEESTKSINKKKRSEEYTQFGKDQSKQLLQNWTQLSNFLITKYNDGMVRDEKMRTKTVGYSDDFYRKAIEDDKERILPVWQESKENKEPRNY